MTVADSYVPVKNLLTHARVTIVRAGLGAYIRNVREQRMWTQDDLAAKVGTTRAYISQIESGRTKLPNADLRRRLAAALGLRHIDLLIAAGEINADEVSTTTPTVAFPHDPRRQQVVERLAVMSPSDAEKVWGFVDYTVAQTKDVRTGKNVSQPG